MMVENRSTALENGISKLIRTPLPTFIWKEEVVDITKF